MKEKNTEEEEEKVIRRRKISTSQLNTLFERV